MAEVKFPQRVKRGSCRVTIYATPSKGRELYTLASERRTRSVTQQSAVARPTIRSASEDASINVMPNRGVTAENRRKNWSFLKARWGLKSAVPNDFNGIPTLNNMRCWLMPLAKDRHKEHVEHLWRVASLAADGSIEQVGAEAFDQCLNLPLVGMASLTIGLFWISPEKFLSADSKTTAYSKAKGITTEPEDYESYRRWLKEMTERLGNNFPQVSHEAHLFACQKRTEGGAKEKALAIHDAPLESRARQYWTLSAGAGGEHWKEFCEQGIAAIGWDGTPDLRGFKSKEELRHKLQDMSPGESSKKNAAHACWQFANDMQKGDIIFAKQGFTKLLGYGVVESDYQFDATRSHSRHIRKVKWLAKGDWEMPEDSKMALKTLTDISPYPEFVKLIANKVGLDLASGIKVGQPPVHSTSGVAYWWLNANPKIWNFEETAVGQKQTYTSHNEKGNNRQKYKYFQEVKTGDLIVGYVTSPQKEVVAVCKITKGLYETEEEEKIEFEKIEQLEKPITYEALQANPDLSNSEPLINNQGSLFKLTEQEYEVIRSLIDEANIPIPTKIESYDTKKAMKGLFLAEAQFDEMLSALKEKKNVVLQGAPGVGKTYIAKRLAYALLESNDPQRIEIIQFHQSYSYEDFIQGFRPTPKGHFDLKYGIFHQFCRRAQREEAQGKPYVFIIDEINRGNLSKIFGELMMLIESDKRGKEHAIPLAYALRRRFRFITLRPEFSSEAFRKFLTDAGAKLELSKKIVARMNALNEAIAADTKNLGLGYQIGHSYFCPRNGIKPDDDWYRRVIDSEIVPLIQEYWFDNEQRVKEQRLALLA